eukprot:TRINITY_DN18609_c0_g1_i1.p1 TRINITY_DN18609_c0_g1~~TRINITY_DN18609_c0_g1_i1.p1  ORF type:complete len:199 (+),score=64.11 TRINITY_DN18609_c0_g1_i1:63-659(+)
MTHQGVVKSYNVGRAFGFISYDGGDVFVHKADVVGDFPKEGDKVTFDLGADKNGKQRATNCKGGTGTRGKVTRFNPAKGWGFIQRDGVDYFVHDRDCDKCKLQEGDEVLFEIAPSEKGDGKFKAIKVQGGTAWGADGGYGTYAGAGFGGYGGYPGYGYGTPWNMMDVMSMAWAMQGLQYGKGKGYGTGYGKGKGKGKW